jgi:hypothetical protein
VTTFPAARLITKTAVSEPIIDAPVEANLRAPISFMEKERVAARAPITWGPEEANLGRLDPCARNLGVNRIDMLQSGYPTYQGLGTTDSAAW